MELHELMSDDARRPVQRLRRVQLNKICQAYNIPAPVGAAAETMIALIESSNIDVTKPLPTGDVVMKQVPVRTESGAVKMELVPEKKPHYSEGKNIDYDTMIETKAKNADLKSENDELKERLSKLESMMLKTSESKPIAKMSMKELRETAKAQGINT